MSVDCPQRHVHRRWDTNTTTRSPEDQCSDSIAAPEQERGDAFFFSSTQTSTQNRREDTLGRTRLVTEASITLSSKESTFLTAVSATGLKGTVCSFCALRARRDTSNPERTGDD